MRPRSWRLVWVVGGVAVAGLACALVLNAFRANVVFFVSPSQIAAQEIPVTRHFRLGGLVERGSLRRDGDGLTVHFVVTDTATEIAVIYHGVLPDLFREGSGVVAQGTLGGDGQFHADQVLAKHDEKYQPPEVSGALRRAQGGRQGLTTLHAAAGRTEGGTGP
ncbi:ccmE family protein [Paraburkholderia xenovorans LB400]|uniref:Cytochrome c-type biogenesis protein CcmE n=1 Tax=Paraburkholderia xenovorans (strain LB400) TaxID=266265 RepID=Q13I09_PARXL|nr:cytochrome c maturation protein CcmE [Paraburkholderia xenovorans]ABE36280.1 Putative cytochrome c-type biogenesis protein CcmE [Paraburkholderia xenovorans LB400]AIP34092.1 ccmE family protein [Paraburkholderia xenovorans LB400]